ncbi:MAG TPA: hypothetical protein VLN57_12730 [Xanthobacteraceae bacterium]|nr:hypothetical protein [Xanthobacteraceae bacterium]
MSASPYLLAVLVGLWISPAAAQTDAPNNMLTAAGFVVKYPDTPEKQEIFNFLPPNRLVKRRRSGKVTMSMPTLADVVALMSARPTPTRTTGMAVSAIVTTTIASFPR